MHVSFKAGTLIRDKAGLVWKILSVKDFGDDLSLVTRERYKGYIQDSLFDNKIIEFFSPVTDANENFEIVRRY